MKRLYIKPTTRAVELIGRLQICTGSGNNQTTTDPEGNTIDPNNPNNDDDAPTRWYDTDRWEDSEDE